MFVAVFQPGFVRGRHHPVRFDVPQLQLFFDAPAHSVAGHHAAQHAAWRRQAFPLLLGQVVDGLQEDRALLQQCGPGVGRGIQGPFQARVADVDGQEAHGGRGRAGPGCADARA